MGSGATRGIGFPFTPTLARVLELLPGTYAGDIVRNFHSYICHKLFDISFLSYMVLHIYIYISPKKENQQAFFLN